MKNKKNVTLILSILMLITISFSGCAYVGSEVNELNGSITGNTYLASFYTNEGDTVPMGAGGIQKPYPAL